MKDLKPVKLQKDTTLTFRINSLLKDHLQSKAEHERQTVTEFLTGLVFKELRINENILKQEALGS